MYSLGVKVYVIYVQGESVEWKMKCFMTVEATEHQMLLVTHLKFLYFIGPRQY